MKLKLIRHTTVPISLYKLLKGQPGYMQMHGFDVQLLSADGIEVNLIKEESGFNINVFPYSREITPIKDLNALWQTYKYFKKEKPQIVHTHTPKAGIVGMLAAKLANVPIRMHTVAGLPLLETKGVKRKVLNFVERLTSMSATNIYPNSFVLKDIMIKQKLAPENKLKVVGNGSSNGIDSKYFSKNNFSLDQIGKLKKSLKIQTNDLVFCFIGRIVSDKGVNELLYSFEKLCQENKIIKLLLVGNQERDLDPISEESQHILKYNKQIISTGWQDDVRPYLAISDIFVFPSYREGFPNVVMQAGAMDLPSIVTNINGCNEIIENEVNGLIIRQKDAKALCDSMMTLAQDKGLRTKLARNSRRMITSRFEQKFVWNELLKEYVRLMDENNIKHEIKIGN